MNIRRLNYDVVVIGGGNVAYDVGRTALRQISLDTARTAKRDKTVQSVTLCSLESLDEMPADDVEIIEGDEEGVTRLNSLGPVEILKGDEGCPAKCFNDPLIGGWQIAESLEWAVKMQIGSMDKRKLRHSRRAPFWCWLRSLAQAFSN